MQKKKRYKYPKIAKRFKCLRENLHTIAKNCTQDMLSDELGITKTQISELENGKREPSITELKAYSQKFKIPIEYLLGLSNNMQYENINIGKELGLSDKTISTLKQWHKENEFDPTKKGWQKEDRSNAFLLNYMFEVDEAYNFFSELHKFCYNTPSYFIDENSKKISNKITCCSQNNKFYTPLEPEDVIYINERSLHNVLLGIRTKVKEKLLEDLSPQNTSYMHAPKKQIEVESGKHSKKKK